nr:MAG TPA: hypothetical protein [Caudoviricetes sp.]
MLSVPRCTTKCTTSRHLKALLYQRLSACTTCTTLKKTFPSTGGK